MRVMLLPAFVSASRWGASRRSPARPKRNRPATPSTMSTRAASNSLRSPATGDRALRAMGRRILSGPAVHQPQDRAAAVGIVLDRRKNLERAAQTSRALSPAPPHEIHGRAVLSPRARREMAVAEGPRLALEAQGAGAHDRLWVSLSVRLQGRELPQQAVRDLARRQVQLVGDAVGEQFLRPGGAGFLPLPAQLLQTVRGHRQPHRLRVAAETLHAIPPGGEEGMQLEARHAA